MNLIRLLLVEDNPAEARLVQLLMQEAALLALEVAVAQTLERAVVMLELGEFQAVLLDLGLPDSQGLDTFTSLHQRFPEVPILILTGSTDEGLGMAAVQGGAQDYLVKDQLEARTLSRSLRYAMERHRLLKELERSATVIRDLQRLLPICASCKKIRDEAGIWEPLEHYLTRVSHMGITHGICPECSRQVLEGVQGSAGV